MVKVKIVYSDGSSETKEFTTKEDAEWYIHMAGDHVIHVIYIKGI